jgi:nitrite reductase/ring-hydroxylating ferredoxin subunit/uncharacterized membrane protein
MSRSLAETLDRLVGRIEEMQGLDGVDQAVADALTKLLQPAAIRTLASGTPVGHPVHPALVALPIGAWSAALYCDVVGDHRAAQRLIGLGSVAAVPTAVAGANDWVTTSGAEQRVGLVHATANSAALSLYAGSWVARRRGHRAAGVALSVAGAVAVGIGGWLGGHLAYALGVGVDTTAFQRMPADWTEVAADADVSTDHPLAVAAGDLPVLLVRYEGRVVALADRCTHRGGPLHESAVEEGCLTCPWHGSRFALTDGSVRTGPATRPQPRLETRVVDGRVQVRRTELRSLRQNPIGREPAA